VQKIQRAKIRSACRNRGQELLRPRALYMSLRRATAASPFVATSDYVQLFQLNPRADWNDEGRMMNDKLMSKLEAKVFPQQSRHGYSGECSSLALCGLLLQQGWNECVCKNIQSFVEVSAGMFGSHTGTETYPMLWHSGIINGGDPQTTAS